MSRYYTIGRNSGLKIMENNLLQKEYDEISDKCKEIICQDQTHKALVICPLCDTGTFAISQSIKVNGSATENRPHEQTHGYAVNLRELQDVFLAAMAEENSEDCFYKEDISVPDLPLNTLAYCEPVHTKKTLESYFRKMKKTVRKDFFRGVLRAVCENTKIQLIVPDTEKRLVQTACYSIVPSVFWRYLYTISGGRCSQSDAVILISDQIPLAKESIYKKMTFEAFLQYGSQWECSYPKLERIAMEPAYKRTSLFAEAMGQSGNYIGEEITAKDLLDQFVEKEKMLKKKEETSEYASDIQTVTDYIKGEASIVKIRKIRRELRPDEKKWSQFQKELQEALEEFDITKKSQKDLFYNAMLLAFERSSEEIRNDRNFPASLYDKYAMEQLLKTKKVHKRSIQSWFKYMMDIEN